MKSALIKSPAEIEILAQGGKILAEILREISSLAEPGVSTWKLNEFAESAIKKRGATPSFKGYGKRGKKFPAALCTSVNDVVVHGIPSRETILREGDIVSLDLGIKFENLYTDAAVTIPVGNVSYIAKKLIAAARDALEDAVGAAVAGNRVGDVSHAIQEKVEQSGFNAVRDLVGHGVGYAVHEEPAIPCFGEPDSGIELEPGMVLAIEPMVTAGDFRLRGDKDGWTVRTKDGSLSAHFEHTVAVTKREPLILTLTL